jgi:hypothetical protein
MTAPSLMAFLDGLITDLPRDQSITGGELMARVRGRGFGMMMLITGALCMVPIPGPNAIVTIPLLFVTAQMVAGFKAPWLPRFILRRSVKVAHLQTGFDYVRPFLSRLERLIRARYDHLVPNDNLRLPGIFSLILAITIALPIPVPGTNLLPALCILAISIALLNRDGLVLWLAIGAGTLLVGKLGLAITLAWHYLFGP